MCPALHLELTHLTDEPPVFFLQIEEFTILPYFSGSVALKDTEKAREKLSPAPCAYSFIR